MKTSLKNNISCNENFIDIKTNYSFFPETQNKFHRTKTKSLFENFENIINRKFNYDNYFSTKNQQNFNHIRTKSNFFSPNSERKKLREENNLKNIHFILSENFDEEIGNNKKRETFITNNYHKLSEKEVKEINCKRNDKDLNLRDLINQASAMGEKIKNESDDIKLLINCAKNAKRNLSDKNSSSKLKINFLVGNRLNILNKNNVKKGHNVKYISSFESQIKDKNYNENLNIINNSKIRLPPIKNISINLLSNEK